MKRKAYASKWLRVGLPTALIVVWVALAGIGGPYFGKISDESSTDLTTFLPENAEATKVNEQYKNFYDENSIGLIVVYDKDGKKFTDNDIDLIKETGKELSKIEQVNGEVRDPRVSEDEKAVFSVVPLESDGDFKSAFKDMRDTLNEADLPFKSVLTGPASFAHDLQNAFAGIDSTLLLVALAVVFVILLLVYRSPLLPFLVLLSSLVALSVAVFVAVLLSQAGWIQINGQVQGILFILVIGAAADYSLLYIARYREELVDNKTGWEATWAALKASYEPIIAAGATVSIGLLCLLLSDLGSNRALGPVGGMGIALAVIATLTFLPALLTLIGRKAFWPRAPKYMVAKAEGHFKDNHPVWAKVGDFVGKYPRQIWLTCVVVLLAGCVGVTQLKAEGVSQNNLVMGYSEAREGQAIMDDHFPAGSGSPAIVIASEEKQGPLIELFDADKGVSSVAVSVDGLEAGAMPVGEAAGEIYDKLRTEIAKERKKNIAGIRETVDTEMAGLPKQFRDMAYESAVKKVPSVDELALEADPFKDAVVKTSDGKVLLQVTLEDAADTLEARQTIKRLRDDAKKIDEDAIIGGTSAAQLDTNLSGFRDVQVVMPAILVAITIILMLLLRSIVAPLLLLVTTVMSFGAAIGVSALLFNHVWHYPGADPAVVLFGFVFLVALGIDYNIFLMTRVREETMKLGVKKGTIKGLVVTGGVITSAGIVLAATFSALTVIPILFLVQIAFIVAFGVLLDTIVVRSLLVPSLTLEIGSKMWWPSKLWRKSKK